MDIKGTKSEENLRKALAGESIARNKYDFFAQIARNNGNTEIAEAFDEMAKNEMMHGKLWFEYLHGYPSDTAGALEIAAKGEAYEWHEMYPSFAKQAREDGLEELAVMFDKVGEIERSHEKRFLTMLHQLNKPASNSETTPAQNEKASEPKKKTGYCCQFCGVIHDSPMDVCDVCHAIGSFEFVEYYE